MSQAIGPSDLPQEILGQIVGPEAASVSKKFAEASDERCRKIFSDIQHTVSEKQPGSYLLKKIIRNIQPEYSNTKKVQFICNGLFKELGPETAHLGIDSPRDIYNQYLAIDKQDTLYTQIESNYEKALNSILTQICEQVPKFTAEIADLDKSVVLNIAEWIKAHSVELRKVKTLDLSSLGLTEIPAELKYFTRLESLDLSRNKLTNLDEFSFPYLKVLHLDRNNFLRSLPDRLGLPEYSSLEVLTIRNCPSIEHLPKSITKFLYRGGYLGLERSSIKSIPEGKDDPWEKRSTAIHQIGVVPLLRCENRTELEQTVKIHKQIYLKRRDFFSLFLVMFMSFAQRLNLYIKDWSKI